MRKGSFPNGHDYYFTSDDEEQAAFEGVMRGFQGIRFQRPTRQTMNFTGQKIGRLFVLGYVGVRLNKAIWLVRCDCGTLKFKYSGHLSKALGLSCGCLSAELTSQRSKGKPITFTHGLSKHPLYSIWNSMRGRCLHPSVSSYERYGGRGIKVCKRWNESVQAFISDMSERPSDEHSLDRKNAHGHYSCGRCDECLANGWPFNVRWATPEQQANNRTCSHEVSYRGQRYTISTLARFVGTSRSRLTKRLEAGWCADCAVNNPANQSCPHRRTNHV